jgi:hypothetical protein
VRLFDVFTINIKHIVIENFQIHMYLLLNNIYRFRTCSIMYNIYMLKKNKMDVFLDPKKLETVNTTNSSPLKNSTSLPIIAFRRDNRRSPLWHFHVLRHFVHVCIQKVSSLFSVSLLKGLICIRCVSGVGDAKSSAMSEIWLSPGPFFPSSTILYNSL